MLGEAEADPAPALVGRVEGQEDVLAAVFGDAGAVVANLDPAVAGRLPQKSQRDDRRPQPRPSRGSSFAAG